MGTNTYVRRNMDICAMCILHRKMLYGSSGCILIGPNETTYLNLITNPTPLQMRPNWLGQRVYPNHRSTRMHPHHWGSQVHPNGWGSWMHPNGRGSRARPGRGRRCTWALPLQLALCACGLQDLKLAGKLNASCILYCIAICRLHFQYAYCTNIHIASNTYRHD